MILETMIGKDGAQIVPVHFFTDGRIACMPGLNDFAANKFKASPLIRSEEFRAVNCPLCMATNAYKGTKTEAAK